MRDVYNVSLCKNGVLGGLMYIKETEIVFCTNKLTVDEKYRRFHMSFSDIKSITPGTSKFPTVNVILKNGENYKFLVFSRKKFLSRINELK